MSSPKNSKHNIVHAVGRGLILRILATHNPLSLNIGFKIKLPSNLTQLTRMTRQGTGKASAKSFPSTVQYQLTAPVH